MTHFIVRTLLMSGAAAGVLVARERLFVFGQHVVRRELERCRRADHLEVDRRRRQHARFGELPERPAGHRGTNSIAR